MFCFISVGVQAVLRFLVSTKILRQYKKLPSDKFMKKKEYFAKHFIVCEISLELQCLVDCLVYFLELSMFINFSLL